MHQSRTQNLSLHTKKQNKTRPSQDANSQGRELRDLRKRLGTAERNLKEAKQHNEDLQEEYNECAAQAKKDRAEYKKQTKKLNAKIDKLQDALEAALAAAPTASSSRHAATQGGASAGMEVESIVKLTQALQPNYEGLAMLTRMQAASIGGP